MIQDKLAAKSNLRPKSKGHVSVSDYDYNQQLEILPSKF